jgi:hypothetical protein
LWPVLPAFQGFFTWIFDGFNLDGRIGSGLVWGCYQAVRKLVMYIITSESPSLFIKFPSESSPKRQKYCVMYLTKVVARQVQMLDRATEKVEVEAEEGEEEA